MTRGTISLVFDDGYQCVYENAVPLLDRYNIPGVFAIPLETSALEKKEQRKIRQWNKWLHLATRGHEIASHSITHRSFMELNSADLDKELKVPAEKLSASTLVYPGGACNKHISRRAARYYSAARTVRKGYERIPPQDPMELHCFNWSRQNWSLVKANALVFWAYLNNYWIIETFHMIDDDEKDILHTIKTSALSHHLSFISRLPIRKATISSVINSL